MPAGSECQPCMRAEGAGLESFLPGRPMDSVEVLDTVSGTWSTLESGTPLPIDVPIYPDEVLCEYKEQPCARYTSGEV